MKPRALAPAPAIATRKGAPLQRKLTIGSSNDASEAEADHLADQVLARPGGVSPRAAPLHVQRLAGSQAGHATVAAPESVSRVVDGAGRPLEPALRQDMEQRFGHDFSHVRVHVGSAADSSAKEVNALAYTVGRNIVFGAGQFAPASMTGRRLLAHELTHVLQQTSAATPHGPQQPSAELPAPVVLRRKAAREGEADTHFEDALKRIQSLLSYGLFDWAITDAEASEAFMLLKAMTPAQRGTAFKRFRLDRLINNLPQQHQAELAKFVAGSGGENVVQEQVEKILTYDFFDVIGSVSESEAKQAMGLLEALPEEQRDGVLARTPRAKRRRLHDALSARDRSRFLQMWQEKEDREFARQREAIRPIERGERLLIRVLLKESKDLVDAFSPQGLLAEVDAEGQLYYATLDLFVSVAGRTRREAENRIAEQLSAKAHVPMLVELLPPPRVVADSDIAVSAPPKRNMPVEKTATADSASPAKPQDPLFERQQEFRRLIVSQGQHLQEQYKLIEKAPRDERLRKEHDADQEAFNRLYEWFSKNENSPILLKVSPESLLAQFRVNATLQAVKASVEKQMREEKEAKLYSPEMLEARMRKTDEFLNLALNLRGESARRFPYTIPVPSEGIDILVTGHPKRQEVLEQIADELMGWSREHQLDDNYSSVDPKQILLYVLKSGYGDALRATDKDPLQAEPIDRHGLVPEKVAAAFGKTVAVGLVVIGAIGAAVGLGIMSGGMALFVLGFLAVGAGIDAYLDRRKVIEEKGYDVPVPVTLVHAAGDAVGVSQLIEGITGERLGIGDRLKSAERSEQLGVGGGSVALLLVGSRAFRFGQGLGRQVRLSAAPAVPETLEGVRLKDLGGEYGPINAPAKPVQNPNPGPVEAQARAALPEPLRIGFDRWMEQIRAKNPAADVEAVLKKMTQERIEAISRKPADDYFAQLAKAEQVANAKGRSAGDPLRPKLRHVEWRDGVTIHYENVPPAEVEIAQAREIQARTGEPVHVFGDTPSGKTFPGIDGTIGEPPRPLQLKNVADPAYLKVHAADAFESATQHGYNKVEVHLRVKNSTLAEIKAAWDAPPAHPRGATVGWETRLSMARSKLQLARLVIEGKDGVWVVEAPPSSPNLPGVPVPVADSPRKKSTEGALP